jgi:hypothetical protein
LLVNPQPSELVQSFFRIYRLQGDFDDENVRLAWNAFGKLISMYPRTVLFEAAADGSRGAHP